MKFLTMTFVLAISMNTFSADKTKTTIDSVTEKVSATMKTNHLDSLIRGEMAAVKAYDQVLNKVKDKNELMKLKVIRENHATAVSRLKSAGGKEVKEDTKSAGVWGTFAEAYTGGAKLMGDEMALKALRQGEEHGISEYKEALDDKAINPEIKKMIRNQFLPKQEEHLKTLKSF